MAIKKTTKTKSTTKKSKSEEQSLIGKNDTLTITIPWSKLEPEYNKAVKAAAKTIKADGFRKGKVPQQLVEERVGTEKLLEKAVDQLLSQSYAEAIRKSGKKPVTQPEFRPMKFAKGNDVVLEAQIAEKPEVTVKNYKSLVKKANKQADKKLKEQEKQAKAAAKKPKSGKKDESKKKDSKSGHDHDHEHDHKPLTDQQKQDFRLQIIYQTLVQEYKPVIPELIVKQEVRADLDQLVKQLEQMQMELDQYLERRQISFEQLSQELTIGALGRIQVAFIMDGVAESAKITVSDQEISDYIDSNVPEESKKAYQDNPQYKYLIRQTLLRQKTTKHLLEI